MQIHLVFQDWEREGKSIYNTPEGIDLSMGDFHSGTTFAGEIWLDADSTAELQAALAAGYQPVFYLISDIGS